MADELKNYISQITLGATTYDLKDLEARADIADIKDALSGGVHTVGETTTPLTDGAATPTTIKIGGEDYVVQTGDIVFYNSKEFLWNGAKWIELGDLTALGDLAYKDTASATYTPAGTVSQPTFTGEALTSTGNFTPEGTAEIDIGSGDANYTPAGTVTQPTFTGEALTSTGTFTPAGTVSQPEFTGSSMTSTGTYTPAGTVSQPTFTGEALTSTGNFTPAGNVAIEVGAGNANYTPAGNVSKPDITVTPSTDSVYSITDVGTLPVLTTNVANEVLTISFSQGTLPTKGSAQTVMTGATAALDNAPVFSGTGVDLEAAFTGTQGSVSVSGTPAGTVSQPTFSGTEGSLSVSGTPEGTVSQPSFSGSEGNLSVSGTPTGTVSQPTFSGTGVDLEVTFTGTQGSVSVTGTPAGTVSQPTFTGTEATITVD